MIDDWDEPTKVDGIAALPMGEMYDANKAYVLFDGHRVEPMAFDIPPIFVVSGLLCFILWARGESGKITVTQEHGH